MERSLEATVCRSHMASEKMKNIPHEHEWCAGVIGASGLSVSGVSAREVLPCCVCCCVAVLLCCYIYNQELNKLVQRDMRLLLHVIGLAPAPATAGQHRKVEASVRSCAAMESPECTQHNDPHRSQHMSQKNHMKNHHNKSAPIVGGYQT